MESDAPSTPATPDAVSTPTARDTKDPLAFNINGKLFSYKGKYEHRERDFFQLYIKALKGAHSAEPAIISFRENIPDSDLQDEELLQLYYKHERRRAERDASKAQRKEKKKGEKELEMTAEEKVLAAVITEKREDIPKQPPPQPPPQTLHPSPRPSISQDQHSAEATPNASPQPPQPPIPEETSPLALEGGEREGGEEEEEEGGNRVALSPPPPVATTFSPPLPSQGCHNEMSNSAEMNAGWAAGPVSRGNTAWERELLRRRERAEMAAKEKCPSMSSMSEVRGSGSGNITNSSGNLGGSSGGVHASGGGAMQNWQSVSLSADSGAGATPLSAPAPQCSQSPLSQPPDTMARQRTSSRGDVRRGSKERKRERKDSDLQKMMLELLQKTSEIQGRIAQLETRESPPTSSDLTLATTGMSRIAQSLGQMAHSQTAMRAVWHPPSTATESVRHSSIDGSLHSAFSSLPRLAQAPPHNTAQTSSSSSNSAATDTDIMNLVKINEQGSTMLHESCAKGHVEDVNRLILMGADLEARDRFARTPLLVASCAGHLPVIHVLSSRGIQIEAMDRFGATAVMFAASGNHAQTLEYLTLRGALLSVIDSFGRGVLHYAVGPKADALLCLLGSCEVDVNKRDCISARTPLHYAAIGGYSECVKVLLSVGAVMSFDSYGNGPLALATLAGWKDAAAALISHSAKGLSWLAVHENALNGKNLRLMFLAGSPSPVGSPKSQKKESLEGGLVIHVQKNDNEQNAVEEKEAYIARDAAGHTLLHLATLNQDQTNVDFLLLKGADVSARDALGRTPLHLCAARGQLTLCKKLVKAGALLDTEDAFRLTPYYEALARGNTQCAEFLLSMGADNLIPHSVYKLIDLVKRQAPSTSPLLALAYRRNIRSARIRECIMSSQHTTHCLEALDEYTKQFCSNQAFLYTYSVLPENFGDVNYVLPDTFVGRRPGLCHILDADTHGRTALMIASLVGDEEGVVHLLSIYCHFMGILKSQQQRSMDGNSQRQGETCYNSVTEALLRQCSPFISDVRGWTALHYAVCKDTITMKTPKAKEAGQGIDFSTQPLSAAQMDDVTLVYGEVKTTAMGALVQHIVHKGCANGFVDPRCVRAEDGRLPFDVAVDEGCPSTIVQMLKPSRLFAKSPLPSVVPQFQHFDKINENLPNAAKFLSLTKPSGMTGSSTVLFWLSRYVFILFFSVLLGTTIIPCFCFYYVAKGERVAAMLSLPVLVLFDFMESISRNVARRFKGVDHPSSRLSGLRDESRVRQNLLLIAVVFVIVLCGLLSIVNVETSRVEDGSGGPPPPAPTIFALNKADELYHEADPEGWESREVRNATHSVTLTHSRVVELGDNARSEERFRHNFELVRIIVLGFCGLTSCAVTALLTRRMLVEQRGGVLRVPAVSRRIDFRKRGNWVMLFITILDAFMLCAVPFVIVHDAEVSKGEGVDEMDSRARLLFRLMRGLLFQEMAPSTAVVAAFSIIFVWLTIAGFACLAAGTSIAASSSSAPPVLHTKLCILQSHLVQTYIPSYLIHFITHTLFLPINFAVLRSYKCVTHSESVSSHPLYVIGSNVQCYEGEQGVHARVGLFVLFLYMVTAGCIGGVLSPPKGGVYDIAWSLPLLTAEKTVFSILAFFSAIFYDQEWPSLGVLIVCTALLIVYAGRVEDMSPYLPSLLQWRMLGYSFTVISLAVVVIFLRQEDEGGDSVFAGVTLLVSSFVVLIAVGATLYGCSQRRQKRSGRVECFKRLAANEEQKGEGPQDVEMAVVGGSVGGGGGGGSGDMAKANSAAGEPPMSAVSNSFFTGSDRAPSSDGHVRHTSGDVVCPSTNSAQNATNRSGGNNSLGHASNGKNGVVQEHDGWVLVGLGEPSSQFPLVV